MLMLVKHEKIGRHETYKILEQDQDKAHGHEHEHPYQIDDDTHNDDQL
jgi:hypothetical protein